MAFCVQKGYQYILEETLLSCGLTVFENKWFVLTEVQEVLIFIIAVPGLFLAFLLKSNFAKLVLWQSIYLIASHLLAQFISTEFANKIKFLLPATLQSLYSCGKMGCTQFLLTLHQPKCVLMPILYCQGWGHRVQQATGCPSNALHNTCVDLFALLRVKGSIEMTRGKRVLTAGILQFVF